MPHRVSRGISGSQGVDGDQRAVEVDVVVDHALGGEAFAGTGVGAIGIGVAQSTVGIELANSLGQAAGVVVRK